VWRRADCVAGIAEAGRAGKEPGATRRLRREPAAEAMIVDGVAADVGAQARRTKAAAEPTSDSADSTADSADSTADTADDTADSTHYSTNAAERGSNAWCGECDHAGAEAERDKRATVKAAVFCVLV
jgi:hypothetical protein